MDESKGYYATEIRIKADVIPPDNETKFAYSDDDYETVEVWREYTEEQLAAIEAMEKQEQLAAVPDAIAELSELISSLMEAQNG